MQLRERVGKLQRALEDARAERDVERDAAEEAQLALGAANARLEVIRDSRGSGGMEGASLVMNGSLYSMTRDMGSPSGEEYEFGDESDSNVIGTSGRLQ